jgi:hypothetical protein
MAGAPLSPIANDKRAIMREVALTYRQERSRDQLTNPPIA